MYYFYLQKTKCRVPLTEEVCQLELDEKRTLTINRTLERIWIYWLYGGVDNLGATYIRAFLKEYRSNMTDLRINKAIELFVEMHKPEHVLNFEPSQEHFEWAKMPDAFEKNLGTMFYETKKYVPMMDDRISDFQNIALNSTDKYERLLEWFERNKTTRKTVQNNERVIAWATMAAMQYGIPMNGYHFTDYVVEKYGTTTICVPTANSVVDNRNSDMSKESVHATDVQPLQTHENNQRKHNRLSRSIRTTLIMYLMFVGIPSLCVGIVYFGDWIGGSFGGVIGSIGFICFCIAIVLLVEILRRS